MFASAGCVHAVHHTFTAPGALCLCTCFVGMLFLLFGEAVVSSWTFLLLPTPSGLSSCQMRQQEEWGRLCERMAIPEVHVLHHILLMGGDCTAEALESSPYVLLTLLLKHNWLAHFVPCSFKKSLRINQQFLWYSNCLDLSTLTVTINRTFALFH